MFPRDVPLRSTFPSFGYVELKKINCVHSLEQMSYTLTTGLRRCRCRMRTIHQWILGKCVRSSWCVCCCIFGWSHSIDSQLSLYFRDQEEESDGIESSESRHVYSCKSFALFQALHLIIDRTHDSTSMYVCIFC